MPFWKRESLHERLARQGGLVGGEPAPHDTSPRWGEAGIHGVPRPREWDATALVEAPELEGNEARFVSLQDGTLLVESGDQDDVGPLADVLDSQLRPPYRAEALRRDERRWAVGARTIDVLELSAEVAGDELELTVHDGERTLNVDGARTFGTVPELERLAVQRGLESFAAWGGRLAGPLWEVRLTAL